MVKRIISAIWLILLAALPAFATVSTETTRVAYTCNGILTSYAYPFKVLADADLLVIKTATATSAETTLTLNTDYTVTGAGSSAGTVVLTAGSKCGTGYTLTILRNMAATQGTDYVDGEAFFAESIENALDKVTMIQQQQRDEIGRVPKLPKTSTITDIALPNPSSNAYIGWNASATGLANLTGPVITTAEQYEVDALVTYGGGVNYTQATIEAALTAIGTTNKVTLLLRPGTWVISSNADWSAYTNVTFKIVPGALISHGAFTVNIPNVEAGLYQIFSGAGAVTISGNMKEVYPQWWGTNAAAIQAACDSYPSALLAHRVVITPDLTGFDVSALTMPANVTITDYATNKQHAKIHMGGADGEFEISGGDPGAGNENPGLILTNRALTGKRNPIIVGKRGIGTKARVTWSQIFSNYGDSKNAVDAADYLLRSGQSGVYTTGTVTVTAGSTTVTGAGTSWTASHVGAILIVGEDEGDQALIQNAYGIVASVTNGTTLELEVAWPGSTANTQEYMLLGGLEAAGQTLLILRVGQNGAFLKNPTGQSAAFYDPRTAAKNGYTAVFGPTRKGLNADNNAIMVMEATEAASPGTGEVGYKWYGSTTLNWVKAIIDKATDYLNWVDRNLGTFAQFIPNATQSKMDIQIGANGLLKIPVVATGSLPAAHASMNGSIIIEDNGAGDRNIIIYAGGQRFRIDGGAAF